MIFIVISETYPDDLPVCKTVCLDTLLMIIYFYNYSVVGHLLINCFVILADVAVSASLSDTSVSLFAGNVSLLSLLTPFPV